MVHENLFDEDEGMVRMTFGEHLEDLRRRLILALLGVIPFVIVGLFIGGQLVEEMKRPVVNALSEYGNRRREAKLKSLAEARETGKTVKRERITLYVDRSSLRNAIRQAFPELGPGETPSEANDATAHAAQTAPPSGIREQPINGPGDSDRVRLLAEVDHDELQVAAEDEYNRNALMTLGPQEGFMAYLKVSLVAGIVMASWWIIYQLWQFVAEGLYQHERHIVYRAMPMSVGLFLGGVVFCFFVVLPVVLNFFFGINEWLQIEPNIRLSEWLGFATILPVIFGICFELPLVMLVLESVGIFRVEDYMNYWRHAILIIAIVAMVVTPTTDPGSMMLLMGPMAGLYFLGIGLVQMRRGGLRALSPVVKLRVAVISLAIIYLVGISIGFTFPAGWLPEDWWREQVWRWGTMPVSWVLQSRLENPTANWMWAVTLGNALLMGLVVLRAGELMLRVARNRK